MEPGPPSVSARELAEALWLAELMAAAESGAPQERVPRSAAPDGPAAGTRAAHWSGENPQPAADEPAQAGRDRDVLVEEHAREPLTTGSRHRTLLPLTLPTPREIQQPLAYIRALRVLRQITPSRHRSSLDVAETIRRSADAGRRRLLPQFRPEPERLFDLLIVADDGPSMALWKHLVAELRSLLGRLAAFRGIRVESLAGQVLEGRAASRRHSERLVVLVLSDCVGPQWRDGRAQELLGAFGGRGPVAVLNPLPRRLWGRTAVRAEELMLRAHSRALPNRALRTLHADRSWTTAATDGVPVPIIGLHPGDVAPWAALISGRAGQGAWITVLADGEAASRHPEPAAEHPSGASADPVAAVGEFARSASPAAFKLAGMLATAPLTLPTMRAVQYLAEQEFGSVHLAEVFLSGLLERSDPEHDFFDFAPGVRKTLLATIRRSDAARIVDRLDEWIARNLAVQPASFQGFIESAHGYPSSGNSGGYVPFAGIPHEALEAIGGSYAEAEPAARERWEGRVFLVGEGGVGKTSTIRNLINDPFDRDEATTHGMRTFDYRVPHPDRPGVEMLLRVWDFGGQEIYHATHQFFLTDGSLFVLLWNNRLGWEQGRLRYWLDLIRARAPRSPVLLLATHLGPHERAGHLPLDDLKREYPQIVESISIDNETGEGLDLLRSMIATMAAGLPLMGQAWPGNRLDALHAVEGLTEYHITPSRLWQTMDEAGLHDHQEQRRLAQEMHDIGSIIYHMDDPRLSDNVILNAPWINSYITRVLDDPEVEREHGQLRRSRLRVLWADLDLAMREQLLDMMDKFDLSYRVAGERGDDVVSLVTERLSWAAPAGYQEVWDRPSSATGEHEIRVLYNLSTTPPGVPTYFIARTHRFTTNVHWRSGALLAHPDGRHRGLIRSDAHRNMLELAVRGPSPASFFAVLDDTLNLTLERYPGLGVRRVVPCPCQESCTETYEYEDLQRRLTLNPPRLSIECRKSGEDVYIPLLLLGLPPSDQDEIRTALARIAHVSTAISGRISEFASDQQRMFLRLQQQLQGSFETECPSVIVVTPIGEGPTDDEYELSLYCEEPGSWHPLPDRAGRYRLAPPPLWLNQIASHLAKVRPILQRSSPLTDAALGAAAWALNGQRDADITAMNMLRLGDDGRESAFSHADSGADYRALEMLLTALDPAREWGGLSRVITPEGLTLYLCPVHAAPYRR